METTTVVSAASTAGPNTSALAVAGAIMLTAAGIIIIPRLMRKYSNKVYKESVKKDEIDFDNLGPEIVRKENNENNKENK